MTAEDDIITRWRKSVEFYEALRYAAAVDGGSAFSTKSLLQLTTDFEGMLGGTVYDGVKGDMFSVRAQVATALKQAAVTFSRHVFDYKEIAAADMVGDTLAALWPQLYRYFAENDKRVESRGMVFPAPSAGGSNIGTGIIARLNVDAWGQVFENQTPDAKLLRCEKDFSLGTNIGEEEFSIASTTVEGRDALEEEGSGKTSESNFAGLTSRTTQSLYGLLNPSFSTATPTPPTADPTDLGGWTANVTLDTSFEVINDYFRGFFGDTSPMALRCTANAWILSQAIPNPKFVSERPVYRHIMLRRKNSADGTFKFRLGRHEISIALTSLTNDVWYRLYINSGDANVTDDGLGAWAKNFGETDIAVEFERSGGTTGQVDIDDLVIGEYSAFDGGFYAVIGGATHFRIEDKFTFTDSEAGAAIVQKWLWRVLGLYLPAIPTVGAQPAAALAGAGAGNLSNGNYAYYYSYVDQFGREGGLTTAGLVTVVDAATNGKVNVSGITAGPAHIVKRKVYRGVVNNLAQAQAKLLTTINDNVTTTYLDNTADGSLGATVATIPGRGATAISFSDPP